MPSANCLATERGNLKCTNRTCLIALYLCEVTKSHPGQLQWKFSFPARWVCWCWAREPFSRYDFPHPVKTQRYFFLRWVLSWWLEISDEYGAMNEQAAKPHLYFPSVWNWRRCLLKTAWDISTRDELQWGQDQEEMFEWQSRTCFDKSALQY